MGSRNRKLSTAASLLNRGDQIVGAQAVLDSQIEELCRDAITMIAYQFDADEVLANPCNLLACAIEGGFHLI